MSIHKTTTELEKSICKLMDKNKCINIDFAISNNDLLKIRNLIDLLIIKRIENMIRCHI